MGRLKNNKGMSIVELLSAIAVMVLVTAVLVTGVRLGVKAYTKSVSMSEAQILCTTLTTAVSDELRYAGTITVDNNGNLISFFSQNGVGTFTSDEGIVAGKPLLSKSAYPYGLKAEVTVTMNSDKVFEAKVTVKSKNDIELSGNEFEVKPIKSKTPEINQQ